MDLKSATPLRNKATFLGTLLLIGALLYLYRVSQFPSTQAMRSIGPAFFPNIVGGAFAFLSVLLILEGRRSAPAPVFEGKAQRTNVYRAVVMVALLVVVSFSLEFLGFVIVSFLFTLVTQLLLGERNALKAALIALAVTVVLYGLFITLLRIPLPRGLIG